MSYIVFILFLLLLGSVVTLFIVSSIKKPSTDKELLSDDKTFSKKDLHRKNLRDWDSSYKTILTNAWQDRYGVPFETFEKYVRSKSFVEVLGTSPPECCVGRGDTVYTRTVDGNSVWYYQRPCDCNYCSLSYHKSVVKSFEELYPSATKNIERYK